MSVSLSLSASLPGALRSLDIAGSDRYLSREYSPMMPALPLVIQMSPLLRRLSLSNLGLEDEDTEALLNAIEAKPFFDTLSFTRCSTENGSTKRLVRYLQSYTHAAVDGTTTAATSAANTVAATDTSSTTVGALRELEISMGPLECCSTFCFWDQESIVDAIFSVPPNGDPTRATVGSSLQCLRMSEVQTSLDDFSLMFNLLGANAARVRLQRLEIESKSLEEDRRVALFECLPKLVHLREFCMTVANFPWCAEQEYEQWAGDLYYIVEAIRRNQSLYQFSFVTYGKGSTFVLPLEERLRVQSYCQRNFLSMLDRKKGAPVQNDKEDENDAAKAKYAVHLKFGPVLFHRAVTLSKSGFGCRTIFRGLIMVGDTVGPTSSSTTTTTNDRKRILEL